MNTQTETHYTLENIQSSYLKAVIIINDALPTITDSPKPK